MDANKIKLHYTPRSHFSRKVRILLDFWELPVELVDAGNVATTSATAFGDNPLMKVPTLEHGDSRIFESDHIARYLVRRFDPNDSFSVLTEDRELLNARAVVNGIMTAEVEIVLAQRTGIDTSVYSRFDKIRESIDRGLRWLEQHHSLIPTEPSYLGFHAVCMWDHLGLYGVTTLDYPAVRERAATLSKSPQVAASAPV